MKGIQLAMMMRRVVFVRMIGILLIIGLVFSGANSSYAQPTVGVEALKGSFSVAYDSYNGVPLLVGLNDATGFWGKDPIYLVDKQSQTLGTYQGTAGQGSYALTLPAKPVGRLWDVTTGQIANGTNGVYIFDIRLMSDVARRGYMAENEDAIASSLRIAVDFTVDGGTLIVWTDQADQQFPTGKGADGKLFTADDPRQPLELGYTLVNLDQEPFQFNREAQPTLNLPTTGLGDVIDYTNLSCAELIPTFLDRVEKYYPFTELHHIDWATLRAKLIPAAKAAKDTAACEKLIMEFGNAVPDGHVNFNLPSVANQLSGSVGMVLQPTNDNKIIVWLVRAGSSAAQAGIKPGAEILKWGGQPIQTALTTQTLLFSNSGTAHGLLDIQLRQLMRGTIGSTVEVEFQNQGQAPQTATLTRSQPRSINAPSEDLNIKDHRLPSGIGYIRLNNFISMQQMQQFDQTLDALIQANVPAIIIDVRDNPGGFSQISDALASRFFDTSFVVGRDFTADGRFVYMQRVDPRPPLYTGLVAILVDENTASSGDLFAYTFKLGKRGLIVGHTPSSGMAGTVSGGQYYLPNGAFIQVPTGTFIDDNGKIVVEGQGVVPDILVPRTVESILSPTDEVLRAAEQALLAGQKPQ